MKMRTYVWSLLVIGALSTQGYSADITKNSPEVVVAPPSTEETLKAVRNELQSKRADVMAKNLTLTAEQASKFWPAYAKFQEEQNVIVDEQLKSLKSYADSYETLDDTSATAFINALLSRDLKMNTLRRKWLAEFQKTLPVRTAVRVIQIDRRLGLVGQISISSQIPLIY